ncbi:hypothetical protein ACIOUE_38185 [Streptomyces xanthochromogenes]|uniref:hypothetical protein n=1 Tax=Streptomyces xanthochromogenes TaxID=67384 RepID=UPI00382C7E9C
MKITKNVPIGIRHMVLGVVGAAILGLGGAAVAHADTQWGGSPQPVVTEVAHPEVAPADTQWG